MMEKEKILEILNEHYPVCFDSLEMCIRDRHEEIEKLAVDGLLRELPDPLYQELHAMFEEMEALQTKEARVYKALDKLEAVIQHNQSDISTWLPLEYELQKTYAAESVKGFPILEKLQEESVKETEQKIIAFKK